MSSTAPGIPTDDRPPIGAVPPPGAVEPYQRLRRTVHRRRHITPGVWLEPGDYPFHHPYVRRFWTPILGPGAIADLLRLATAASRGRSLPRPVHLGDLARAGFVTEGECAVLVRVAIPCVPAELHHRLPPALRRELTGRDPNGSFSPLPAR